MNVLRLLLLGILAAAVLAACSGSDPDPAGTGPDTTAAPTTTSSVLTTPPPPSSSTTTGPGPTTSTPTTTTTTTTTTSTNTLPPSPLNGLGVADVSRLERRVMAVKIDNHRDARPQSGIQEAEAVIELLVEGGLTRFIALYHAVDSDYVGPIRSIRPTDPTLLKPLGAPMQISGGQRWIRRLVSQLGVDFMGEVSSGSTFRIPSRPAPHNLYGDTAAMRERADGRGYPDAPPQPMFVFGKPAPPAEAATRIRLSWSGANDVNWEWNGSRYLRFQGGGPHMWVGQDGDGEQIAFDTLVVLIARRYTASPPGGESGSSVPALDTVGNGEALVFYGGNVVTGVWQRDSIEEPFALTTPEGDILVVPPGRLWVSVFPSNREVSWG